VNLPGGPGASGHGSGPHICTIIACNYLPAARVLARSFMQNNPSGTVSVLLLDDVHRMVDASSEPFEIIRPEELGETTSEIHRMAAIYDVTEFATALKPWLLEHLLDRGLLSVLYLDPDIFVYDELTDIVTLADRGGIVITPHALAPFPRDKKMTDETTILANGIYNLGFIGVGQGSRGFLHFWKERLRRECRVDPIHMRFVDQRWVDFVPAMFDSTVLRDPRWNVAYWNLHEREVRWTGTRYEVGGKPLGFFHFSGYSPRTRHMMSKYQVDRPRILLSEWPVLAKMFDEYGDALESEGFGSDSGAGGGYGLSRALNGVPLDSNVRKVYLERLIASDEGEEDPPPDPFDPAGAADLVEWLNSVVPNKVGVARLSLYQATLYAHTPELQRLFPDPQVSDFGRFQHWLRKAALEGRVHPLLVPEETKAEIPALEHGPIRAAGSGGEWVEAGEVIAGVNVAGYLRAELGIGESARLAISAIDKAGIPFQSVVFELTSSRQDHPFSTGGSSPQRHYDYDTNLVVVNADQLPHFAAQVGPGYFNGRYTIGSWAWELEEFPAGNEVAFELVDEIWALSEFTRQSIAAVTSKPVFSFPLPIVKPSPTPGVGRKELGLPQDRFIFLFCFDLFSVLERKNPIGLIRAFSEAFAPGEGPLLVLKINNGEHRPMDLELLRRETRHRDDIMLMDRYLSVGDLASLMECSDCYVSLHRSEGFGLTMGESMALGKPVIATGYSGNLDFMNESNSFLVPYEMGTVPKGSEPYTAGSRWAEPDLEVASRLMRTVFEDPHLAASVAEKGRSEVKEHHSIDARATWVKSRYQQIRASRAAPIPTRPRDLAPPRPTAGVSGQANGLADQARMVAEAAIGSAESTENLVAAGAPIDGSLQFGKAEIALRRVVRRLRRNEVEHQRQVDIALSEQVADISRAVRDLAIEIDGLKSLYASSRTSVAEESAERESTLRILLERLETAERRISQVAAASQPGEASARTEIVEIVDYSHKEI
jgi:glycosyltransferase involved in cell wall biosynthesis